MNIKQYTVGIILFFGLTASASAEAVIIIANKSNTEKIERNDLQDFFSGRRKLVGNTKVSLIDQPSSSRIKEVFYQMLLKRSLSQVSTMWSELVFSGRATTPLVAIDDNEVLKRVMSNPNAIGYVSEKADVSQVNVLLKLTE